MATHLEREGIDMGEQAAWMMAAFGDDREYAGNTGYEDVFGVVYSYDSFVPNHRRVKPGDLAFLHSRAEFQGVARIDRIEISEGTKTRLTCPECGKGAVFPRARKRPEWRCKKCRAEFDAPVEVESECKLFSAWFGGMVVPNRVNLPLEDVKAAVPRPADQLSIQAMDPAAARRLLERLAGSVRECVEVAQEVVTMAKEIPAVDLYVSALRERAVTKRGALRGAPLLTFHQTDLLLLRPEISGVGEYDDAIEAWILEGAPDLRDALLAHAADDEERQLIAETFRVAPPPPPPEDPDLDDEFGDNVNDDEGVEEGRQRLRRHWGRERNRKVVAQAKAAWSTRDGRVHCAACGFDFEAVYGKHGAGFIEAHHVVPLHQVEEVRRTTRDDLAPLCSNCHRIIHKIKPIPGVEVLRLAITSRRLDKLD
jgi:hypothetical protein